MKKKKSNCFRIYIGEDKQKFLEWKLSDINLFQRVQDFCAYAEAAVHTITSSPDDETEYLYVKHGEKMIKEFDKAFGSGASAKVFQGNNPLAVNEATGNHLIVDAINLLIPPLEKFVKKMVKVHGHN